IGLNALILGAGAAVARPVYDALARARRPEVAMAVGTAAGQALAGGLWLVAVAGSLRIARARAHLPTEAARLEVLGGIALPMWAVGVAIEAAVAFGLARFLDRVRPDLLPRPRAAAAGRAVGVA